MQLQISRRLRHFSVIHTENVPSRAFCAPLYSALFRCLKNCFNLQIFLL